MLETSQRLPQKVKKSNILHIFQDKSNCEADMIRRMRQRVRAVSVAHIKDQANSPRDQLSVARKPQVGTVQPGDPDEEKMKRLPA